MSEFSPISRLVAAALPASDEFPLAEAQQARLRHCWQKLLGAAALNSEPLLFNSGRLVAFSESPLWGSEIRNRSRRLLLQLEEEGFRINRIQVRVRPRQPVRKRPYSTKKVVTAPDSEYMRSAANRLQHPALKEAMLKLARKGK